MTLSPKYAVIAIFGWIRQNQQCIQYNGNKHQQVIPDEIKWICVSFGLRLCPDTFTNDRLNKIFDEQSKMCIPNDAKPFNGLVSQRVLDPKTNYRWKFLITAGTKGYVKIGVENLFDVTDQFLMKFHFGQKSASMWTSNGSRLAPVEQNVLALHQHFAVDEKFTVTLNLDRTIERLEFEINGEGFENSFVLLADCSYRCFIQPFNIDTLTICLI